MNKLIKKCLVILIAGQKGGAGKTSTCINIGGVMFGMDKTKQVIIDLDTQRSMVNWSTIFRDQKLHEINGFFPAVTPLVAGKSIEEMIELLSQSFDIIYLDTAGYIGDDSGSAKRILEQCIPLADVIVIPSRSVRSEVHSAIATIEFIESVLEDVVSPKKATKVMLANALRGGERGYTYLQNLLKEHYNFEQYTGWKLLDSFIPSSNALGKNMDLGGNLFVPRRINSLVLPYFNACKEIFDSQGVEYANQETCEELVSRLSENLKQMRKLNKAEAKAKAKAAAAEAAEEV
jgi:cellulose biosynthesis protein BcsQ